MCGIVGLFLKDQSLEPQLGEMLADMLIIMTDRGPDSAGIAIYNSDKQGGKITIQSDNAEQDFAELAAQLSAQVNTSVDLSPNDTHAVLTLAADKVEETCQAIRALDTNIRIMSRGEAVEIYKEVGLPEHVAERFNVQGMSGTHGIGHTRMATESAVTTLGAHPFNTGSDQCLVHNGSLSNHNAMRRKLAKHGVYTDTKNDTEVAAAYLTWRLQEGDTLGQALENSLDDLDGFFTFLVGTKDGFGVVRDPIACKPAVMAETDRYVAFGSEYRALVNLPNIENARVWEPEPATVYFWNH